MKKYLKIALILALGALVGAAGVLILMDYWFDSHNKAQALVHIVAELKEANKQYKEADPKVAIYAMERTLAVIEFYRDRGLYRPHGLNRNWEIALIHARIARMYRKDGDLESASKRFQMAIELFSSDGWKLKDVDELNKAVDLIDEGRMLEAFRKYGKHRE